MGRPVSIISDDEVIRVHANANFGDMTPRDVVDEGVLKYAFGYASGYTQMTILLEHGLIYKPNSGSYHSSLTKKGFRYLRSLFNGDQIDILLNLRGCDARHP